MFKGWHQAVNIAGPHSEDHIGAERHHEVGDLFGSAEILVHGLHLTQNHAGGYSGDGFFACGVEWDEDGLVKIFEHFGELVCKVACAGVEMWLENSDKTFARIEVAC